MSLGHRKVIRINIGFFDRVVRLFAGLGLVFFDYLANASWEIIFLVFGAWSVTTSVFGWCPFYKVFGVRTCPTSFQEQNQTQNPE